MLVVVLAAGLLSPACTSTVTKCTPTSTKATEATKVRLAVGKSSVLHARLTADGNPVKGRSITFVVLKDDEALYHGTSTTGDDGRADYDLKQVDLQAANSIVRGNKWEADFGGDVNYCSSSDSAAFRLLR
jgi:hypothetical protein